MTILNELAASYVAEPLTLKSVDDIQWSEQAEVLVVGYGGAGVCAAVEASLQGADVLVVERFEGGGATSISGGIVYAGGTPFQKEAGIEDTPEEMYKYLKQEIGDAVEDATLRAFCNESSDNIAWLIANGVNFGSQAFAGKRSYPPIGYDLYFSGNEAAPAFSENAMPAQRGHRVKGAGYTGKDFYAALKQKAQQQGVRLHTQTLASRLVIDEDGSVLGVEVSSIPKESEAFEEHLKVIRKVNKYQRLFEGMALKAASAAQEIERKFGEKRFIRATKGVILTTGSFAFNREMVRHYAPKYGQAMPLGTISCDGSGILLGQSVGAAVGHMDSVTAWRSISPSEQFIKSIVVNREGRRFIAEDAYLGHLGHAMANQTDQVAWLILDSHTYWNAYKEALPRRGEEAYFEFRGPLLLNLLFNTTRGKTLAQLAEKIGVDAVNLEAEVDHYNQCAARKECELRKKPSNYRALDQGTYYAIDISVASKKYMCPTIPMGGLRVNEQTSQVVREDDTVINGLYAAGRAAVGIPSGFYVSGTSLADCVFSGRRAAKHIVTSSTANNFKQVESL